MKRTSFIQLSLFLLLFYSLSGCKKEELLIVKSAEVEITFNRDGEIGKATFPKFGQERTIGGFTSLKDCQVLSVNHEGIADSGVRFIKSLKDTVSGNECVLTETFTPTENSIRWEIEIIGEGANWSTPIETHFQYPVNSSVKHWLPWADPRGDISGGGTDNALIANAIINSGDLSDFNSWADPLVAMPVHDALWHYGAPRYEYDNPGILYCPFQGDVMCIPMISFLEEEPDFGLSLVLSPEDLMLDVNLETTADGGVKFSRFNHRLGGGKVVRFAMDIVFHQADWRSSLAWASTRYHQYFYPVNPLAQQIAGTGAYSNSDVDFDAEKMKKMAFSVNWRASFDFPFMGMFIPPVDETAVWPSFVRERNIGKVKRKPTSIPKMQQYCQKMNDNDFHVLSYFNVTEFGTLIEYPKPESKRKAGEPIWKDANDYLYEKLSDAMLFVPDKQKAVTDKGIYSAYPGKPFWTWEKAVAMDPGVKSYQDFLVDQAKRTVEKLPDSYGICIDRMDWTRFYNHKTDDGLSWMGGQAVGSMNVSWHQIMERLNPIFHDNNKLIFVNNHVKRIDQLRYVDGIFDEFTYAGSPVNTVALMCTHKPALGWMSSDEQLLPDPDQVMQKYLYMGIFPMAPFPGNDHSIRPSELADKVYLDYGQLFKLLKGKEWVLKPNVVSTLDGTAKVNMFKTFHGYTIPVVYSNNNEETVLVNDPDLNNRILTITAHYPGANKTEDLAYTQDGETIVITTPVKRNCAVIKIKTE